MKSEKFIKAVEHVLQFMSRFADGSWPVLRFSAGYEHLHIDFPASDVGDIVREMLEDVFTTPEMQTVFVDFSLATFKHTLTLSTPTTLKIEAIADVTSGALLRRVAGRRASRG